MKLTEQQLNQLRQHSAAYKRLGPLHKGSDADVIANWIPDLLADLGEETTRKNYYRELAGDILSEIAAEVGCEADNERVLLAISQLKDELAATRQQLAEAQTFRKLNDVQWMNIVNHDHVWQSYSKEEAVHEAVKMVEAKLAEINTKGAALSAKEKSNEV